MTAVSMWLRVALLVTVCTLSLELNPQTAEQLHTLQLRKELLRTELDTWLGTCKGSYSMKAIGVTKVAVSEVKVIRQGVCSTIANGTFERGKGRTSVVSSLQVENKSDDFVTNIAWTYSSNDATIPGRFVVALDFVDYPMYADLDRVCIVFNMTKSKPIENNVSLMFHLDCIPLVITSDVLMYVQILGILKGKFSDERCSRKRLDPSRKVCETIEGSDTMVIPISKSFHRGKICACFRERHGKPVLTWTHDPASRKFNISLTNIPPYLEGVEIEIVNSKNTMYYEILEKNDVFGTNSLMATSNNAYPAGNYSVVLIGNCPRESNYHFCSAWNEIYVKFPQYIVVEETVPPPQFSPASVVTIATVVGGVVVICLIAAVVFFYRKCCRKKAKIPSSELEPFSTELVEMPPSILNNTDGHMTGIEDQTGITETEMTEYEEGKRSEVIQRQPLLSDIQSTKYRDEKYDEYDKPQHERFDKTTFAEHHGTPFGCRTMSTYNHCQTHSIKHWEVNRSGVTHLLPLLRDIQRNQFRDETYDVVYHDGSENLGPPFGHRTIPTESTEYGYQTRAVKHLIGLLYRETDDDVFCAKKERLLHEMRRNGLVFGHVSQHYFAERASHSTENTNVVIIVSKGMNAMCSPLREQQQKWDHDNLPKTVLFNLRHAKVGEYVVHLVSLEHDRWEGERLLSEFRGLLVYPKQPEGRFIYDYNFHGNGFDFVRGMPFEDFINKLLT
ncbi:uncharacterized protein LOC127881621 isoform X5 [Dreissena polymorpha]|uniref:Uncharacterized protein n=2 Tax=Dreissena polymorpha TaxID=45954 RepID=A0A9D4JPH8_DREPO|nr:uncharacterized protein LOC127881621 isoform X5 [Dreissena polymorpha]KAH3819770.1 hypothetical protein DPMN_121514 [Dreissena polymorpha]